MLQAKMSTEILYSPPGIFLFIYTSPSKPQIYRLSTAGFTRQISFHSALNLSLLGQSTSKITNADGYKGHFQFQFPYFKRIMSLKEQVVFPILWVLGTDKTRHYGVGQRVSNQRFIPAMHTKRQ